MPRISILIPNYNHSEYLHQRIQSVLEQSYQDFEVILLDDSSTDDSRTIIESYRSSAKISHIIYNNVNSGSTFKQWDKGIAAASGELIWIAESDDWCEKTLLEELVSGFDKDKDCVISYCQSICVLNSNIISWFTSHSLLSESMEGNEFIQRFMVRNNTVYNASMVLWKKQFYSKITPEFLSYRYCGDWLFWIEIAQFGNVHISGKILNYYRKHDKDVTSSSERTGLSVLEPMKLINTLYNRNIIDDKAYNMAYKYHFKNYWLLKKHIEQGNAEAIQTMYRNPLSGQRVYFKMLLSAINKYYLRGRFRK